MKLPLDASMNRLTEISHPGYPHTGPVDAYEIGFEYDGAASRILRSRVQGATSEDIVYHYDDFRRLTAAELEDGTYLVFEYDASGRMTRRTAFSTTNTSVPPLSDHRFLYSGWRVIEEHDVTADPTAAASASTLRKVYLYGSDDLDDVSTVLVYDAADTDPAPWGWSAQAYAVHRDIRGSVVALTDSSGAVALRATYDAFGQPIFFADDGAILATPPVDMALLWQGARWDADLGLYYMRYRWYDPEQGQFLTRDPLGLWGDPMNLGHGSLFAGHDPVNYADPFGLWGSCASIEDYGSSAVTGRDTVNEVLSNRDQLERDVNQHIERVQNVAVGSGMMIGGFLTAETGAAVATTGVGIGPGAYAVGYGGTLGYLGAVRVQAGIEGVSTTAPLSPGALVESLNPNDPNYIRGGAAIDFLGGLTSLTNLYLGAAKTPVPACAGMTSGSQSIGGLADELGESAVRPQPAGPLGLGSTVDPSKGRFPPRNLREQLAVEQTMSNPSAGTRIDRIQMKDPRWPAAEGWQKWRNNVNPGGDPIDVHYTYNPVLGIADDPKIVIDPKK